MLDDQSLPFFLWAEACSIVVYVQNMSSHRALGSKTFDEMFTGKKPEIGHFRIFGCLTYSYVPFEKRTNLEATGERGIFVGCGETSNAFRIFLHAQRKVVVRREVRFEKERAFRKSRESEEQQQQMTTPQVTVSQSSASQGGG